MNYQKTNYLAIKEKLKKLKYENIIFEKNYVNYLKEYNLKSNFLDISFILEHKNSFLFCPLTIDSTKNKKDLNFFGEPFFLIIFNKNIEIFNFFEKKIKKIIEVNKINNVNFLFKKPIQKLEYLNNIKKEGIYKISIKKKINLNLSID